MSCYYRDICIKHKPNAILCAELYHNCTEFRILRKRRLDESCAKCGNRNIQIYVNKDGNYTKQCLKCKYTIGGVSKPRYTFDELT